MGDVPDLVVKSIAAHLEGYVDLPAEVLPAMVPPAQAFDERRLQYDAALVLKALEEAPLEAYDKVIAVTSVDLFIPIFTYVYGEAAQGGRFALVSTFRLTRNPDGSVASRALLLGRTGKVALHELGHLFNLHHCMDERCLMHFSGDLATLDRTPPYLCRYCALFFREAVAGPGL